MKKLYEKSQLLFSLLLIALYIVCMSLADDASFRLYSKKLITAPVVLLMAAFLIVWLAENRLLGEYGFKAPTLDCKKYLCYIPLAVIVSANLWWGAELNMSGWETALYIVSMLGVGIVEELIFRGFLFKAMCRDNVKWAIAVSSLTFGFGHIVNLINGADLVPTLLQIAYAVAIGFLFTVIFYRSKSLVLCMAVHGVFNALSAFAVTPAMPGQIVTASILTVLPIAYGIWILAVTEESRK